MLGKWQKAPWERWKRIWKGSLNLLTFLDVEDCFLAPHWGEVTWNEMKWLKNQLLFVCRSHTSKEAGTFEYTFKSLLCFSRGTVSFCLMTREWLTFIWLHLFPLHHSLCHYYGGFLFLVFSFCPIHCLDFRSFLPLLENIKFWCQ